MYLIFDTETTGLPKDYNAPITDTDNWPRVVQIAWQLHDEMGNLIEHQGHLIKPENFDIPFEAEQIHGISTQLATEKGEDLETVLYQFNQALKQANFVVGQNIGFDIPIMGCEFFRKGINSTVTELPVLDTCTEETAALCQIPGGKGGKFKLPTLTELHEYLFGEPFAEAHNATADVEATTRCFLELIRKGHFTDLILQKEKGYVQAFQQSHPSPIPLQGLKHLNLKKESEKLAKISGSTTQGPTQKELEENKAKLAVAPFAHLHNHSQYSVLQSTMSTKDLVQLTAKYKMPAVALTDHANMMGAFHFVKDIKTHNALVKNQEDDIPEQDRLQTIKPILGCEFYVCENHTNKSNKDNGYQIVLLAKNKDGYQNLIKMVSIAYIDGFYYVPRIDKKVVEQYKDNIIALSGNLYGEVPQKILNVGEKQAEEALMWWKETFGEDFYLEIMRHQQEDEDRMNEVLVRLAEKHEVKLLATNNTYYGDKQEAEAHDILLCIKDGELVNTPKGRGRGYRYGLPNEEYYFKSSEEMKALFRDIPEAILTIQEVIDKVEPYDLARDVLLPKFDIPQEFKVSEDDKDGGKRGENAYLRYLSYEGAKERYGEITPEIDERLQFELEIIENSGYPGYFLIVEDFIREARNMGVSVGPGRGSAAGAVVAYCLKITNIDPIKYDLLFERFLNPDRVSMPDIDIDFDDEGRGKVLDYVIKKYGTNQVAQIITYGTMAAKSSIRDTARVLDLPLNEADQLAKLLPLNAKFRKIFGKELEELKKEFRSDDLEKVQQLLEISKNQNLQSRTVNMARVVEGSLRNTGIHACGVIITPDDITNFVPVSTAKDSELYVTQFDNAVVESAGLLKMDFLGLKTLTLIKDTVKIVKARTGINLDPDSFPLDDNKTYELFQRGETVGIFQYESAGMQKYLRELKPTVFEDLIAMNALFRPGPMDYIPKFIARKHGAEEITYDLPEMEEYLKDTYGITVYQEQVMLLSQKLAGFTRGQADSVRKAMGKKIFSMLEDLKPKFMEGGEKNGHPKEVLEKIWKDWEAFASYAFNKSHSTCYAYIAFQTAYLKAHYPAEYMAAVLSNNMNDIKQVTFFMEECRRMGLRVLGPDINESFYKFAVNQNEEIRFGMGAVKGVGKSAVEAIVEERKINGNYKSIFDLAKRVDLRAANKKSFENLALAGGFDAVQNSNNRAQYFQDTGDGLNFIEKVIKYGSKYQSQKNSAQTSLFGDASEVQIPEPVIPPCNPWGTMEKLRKEKEVVGIYLSGHPLDDYKNEINFFCKVSLTNIAKNIESLINKEITFAGVITEVQHRVSKNNKGWASFTVEDYTDAYQFRIFGEEYLKFRHFLVMNAFIYVKIFVKPGYLNQQTQQMTEPRIQFIDFKQLQDVMSQNAQKLTLKMNLDWIKEQRIQALKNTITTHTGDKILQFEIKNQQNKSQIELKSRNYKVKITNELINELSAHEVLFKIN